MKDLNPRRIKTISFLAIALILISITVLVENFPMDSKNMREPNIYNYTPNQVASQETAPESDNSARYTVKEHQGVIAVFQSGLESPILTERILVKNLPEQDKQLLEKGVEFRRYKDMLAFFENYE